MIRGMDGSSVFDKFIYNGATWTSLGNERFGIFFFEEKLIKLLVQALVATRSYYLSCES